MSYKLYKSKKTIFWDTPNGIDKPHWFLGDDWFDFELVPNSQINFVTRYKAEVVERNVNVTYYMLDNDGERSYWFVKDIKRILKEGNLLDLELDVWMTYSRKVFRILMQSDTYQPLIERIEYTLDHMNRGYQEIIAKALNSRDELTDNLNLRITRLIPHQRRENYFRIGSPGSDILTTERDEARHLYGIFAVYGDAKGEILMIPQLPKCKVDNGPELINHSFSDVINHVVHLDKDQAFFIGVYRAPYPTHLLQQWTVTINGNSKVIARARFTIDDLPAVSIPISYRYQDYNKFIDFAVRGHNNFYWGKDPRKIKELLLGNIFSLVFSDGFYAINLQNKEVVYPHHFGTELPSPDANYFTQVKKLQDSYNMGLATSIASAGISAIGGIAGIAAAPVTGGLSGAAGVGLLTSGANTIANLILGGINHKIQLAGLQPTYINSNSMNLWTFVNVNRMFRTYETQGTRLSQYDIAYEEEVDHTQLKNIYNQFGYPCYQNINLKDFLINGRHKDKFIAIFNEGWLLDNIRDIVKNEDELKNESSELLAMICADLAKGVRVKGDILPITREVDNGLL